VILVVTEEHPDDRGVSREGLTCLDDGAWRA
jgi:hypothetical protein